MREAEVGPPQGPRLKRLCSCPHVHSTLWETIKREGKQDEEGGERAREERQKEILRRDSELPGQEGEKKEMERWREGKIREE